jgi:hypothetical protein
VLALTENRGLTGDAPPSAALWRNMVADIHRVDARCSILSSEFLCDADDEAAREIVDSIGRDRLHVVVTLRPLSKILPSAWQQYVRNQLTAPYDDWLDAMFNRAPYRQPTPSFWRRHRHGKLVARWTNLVGPDRMKVVIVDERDRDGFLRAFEAMLGVPDGLLVPSAAGANRSLTAAEVEMIRQINIEFAGNDWPDEVYHKFIRNGVIWRMLRRTPNADEPRIITPQWAQERAADAAAQSVRRINRLGVRIVGDAEALKQIDPVPANAPRHTELPVAAAVGSVVAILYRSGLIVSPDDAAADEEEEDATHAVVTAPVAVVEQRLRRRARRIRVWYGRRRALRAANRQPSGQVAPPAE